MANRIDSDKPVQQESLIQGLNIPCAGETIRMADGSVGKITSVVSGVDLTNPLPHAEWEVFYINGAEVLARRIDGPRS